MIGFRILAEQPGEFLPPLLSGEAVLPEVRDLEDAGRGFQRFSSIQFYAQLLVADPPELSHFALVRYRQNDECLRVILLTIRTGEHA